MTEEIKLLNRRIGDALGRPNGTDPRFAWMESQDCVYFIRRNATEDFRRICWADRIGKCWLLCQWCAPEITMYGITMQVTSDQWFAWFQGRRPFPAKGEYKPHVETALPSGAQPTAEDTAFYIATLRQQIEAGATAGREQLAGRVDATTERCIAEAEQEREKAEMEFYDSVGSFEPLSWKLGEPHTPCDRGGPISFGGV